MIKSPFPSTVGFAALNFDLESFQGLHEKEELIASHMGNTLRRAQFTAGRIAAHQALSMIAPSVTDPILRFEDGSPQWPNGIIGSISHTNTLAVACVAHTNDFAALGIDIEIINRKFEHNISRKILTKHEDAWVNENGTINAERLLQIFSAKECLYKALFPICKTYFGFLDAELIFNSDEQHFEAILLRNLSNTLSVGSSFHINLTDHEDFIMTSIAVK